MVKIGRVISTALQFIDNFTKPSKKAIESMKKMGREAIRAGKKIQDAGQTISNAGSGLTAAITVPVAGVATAAYKMSSDFENSMAKVSTIADTTKTPMEKLKKQVVDLSNQVGVGVSDLAEAQYQAISAGVDTASSADFVGVAVKAAKGGFTDTTTAVDGLTTVLNAYGMEAGKAKDISDQMLAAQNFGKTSFGDMASSMGNVIPIASSLNVSTGELFGSIAVLTKNGIATSEAVTGLKAAYSNVLKPSADASKTAQQLGLDFSAAHLKSVGWAKFLSEIKEKTGGNAETMAKLFGSTEALNSVTVLAGKGSGDFAKALKLMGNSGGMTEKAYQKMLTPTERLGIAFNKVKNSLLKFGAAVSPVIEKVAGAIGEVGDKLSNLSGDQVDTIVKFAGIAAAVGPALVIFGKMVKTIGKVHKTFGAVSKAAGNAGGLFKLITGPAGIVIAVLAGVALAAFLIIKNWDKVKVFFKKFGQAVEPIVDGIKTAFDGVVQFVQGVFTGNWKSALGGLKKIAKGAFSALKNIIKAPFKAISGIVKGGIKSFKKINIVKNIFRGLGKAVKKALSKCGVDMDKFGATIQNIKKRSSNILNGLKKAFTTAFHAAGKAAKALKPVIEVVFHFISNAIKKAMHIIVQVIKAAFGAAKGYIAAAVNAIASIISGVLTVFDGLITFISGVFTCNWRKAWEGVKTIFKGIFDTFAAICKSPINAVIGIINGAISSLNKINVTIPDWVPGLGGKSFGINVPTIPMLYKGTKNWKGGMAMIHDRGGEIVDLPQGSRVYPHDKSIEMARKEGRNGKGGAITINIQKLADKIEVRSDEDIDRIAEELAYKLKKIAFNTGTA